MRDKKYLFICGCARSGTSVTTELIRCHSKIALGRERYNSLFKSNKLNFNPSLFNSERFCKVLHKNDSHHQRLNEYYEKAFSRWKQCTYFGDKIPSLFKEYEYLINTFKNVKIIFMLRNIIDVCQSWEERRLHSIKINGKWPKEKGFLEAINEWNISLNNTIEAVKKHPNKILIVPYSNLFSDRKLLNNIFNFIDLTVTEELINYWDNSMIRKKEIEEKRTIKMSTHVKNQICLKADFNSYRLLKSIYK